MSDFETAINRDFGAIADLVRLHAQQSPARPALADATRELSYGALDALMDRIAASLQRDGLNAGDAIAICAASSVNYAAVFLGALRAGIAVAPLAPGSTPASLARMIEDAERARSLHRRGSGRSHRAAGRRRDPAHRARRLGRWPRLRSLARAGRHPARRGRAAARMALQHHLFVRHHRRAQRHRAGPRHALGARAARREVRIRAGHGHAALDAALLQHHAGRLLPDHRLRRQRDPDAEVRRRGLSASWPSATASPTPCWCRCSTSA